MVLLGGASGEGGGGMIGISALTKETAERELAPSKMWGYREKTVIYEPGGSSSQTLKLPVP